MPLSQRVFPACTVPASAYRDVPRESVLDAAVAHQLVGLLHQVGALSAYATDIAGALYRDARATAQHIAGVGARVSGTEQALPSVEHAFAAQSAASFYAYKPQTGASAAVSSWRNTPRLTQSLFDPVTQPPPMVHARAAAAEMPRLSSIDPLCSALNATVTAKAKAQGKEPVPWNAATAAGHPAMLLPVPCAKEFSNPNLFFELWVEAAQQRIAAAKADRKPKKPRPGAAAGAGATGLPGASAGRTKVVAQVAVKTYSAAGAEFAPSVASHAQAPAKAVASHPLAAAAAPSASVTAVKRNELSTAAPAAHTAVGASSSSAALPPPPPPRPSLALGFASLTAAPLPVAAEWRPQPPPLPFSATPAPPLTPAPLTAAVSASAPTSSAAASASRSVPPPPPPFVVAAASEAPAPPEAEAEAEPEAALAAPPAPVAPAAPSPSPSPFDEYVSPAAVCDAAPVAPAAPGDVPDAPAAPIAPAAPDFAVATLAVPRDGGAGGAGGRDFMSAIRNRQQPLRPTQPLQRREAPADGHSGLMAAIRNGHKLKPPTPAPAAAGAGSGASGSGSGAARGGVGGVLSAVGGRNDIMDVIRRIREAVKDESDDEFESD